MALILDGTQWENAVSTNIPVFRTFNMTSHPNYVFIQIGGPNPGFAKGDPITFVHSETGLRASGNIDYIYDYGPARVPSATWPNGYYNLYLKNIANYKDFASLKGGMVIPGIVDAPQKSTSPFVSASTILNDMKDTVVTADGSVIKDDVVTGGGMVGGNQASLDGLGKPYVSVAEASIVPADFIQKNKKPLLIGLGVLAVIVIIRNM